MVSFEFFKKIKILFISIIVYLCSVEQGWVPQHVYEGHWDNFMELVSPSTVCRLQGFKFSLQACPTTTLPKEWSLQQLRGFLKCVSNNTNFTINKCLTFLISKKIISSLIRSWERCCILFSFPNFFNMAS